MKPSKKKRYILIFLFIAIMLALYVSISRLYYNKFTDNALATLSEQDYYIVKSKGCKDSLIIVMSTDSNVFVTYPTDTLFLKSITKRYQGAWVNRYWIYSCHGCMAIKEGSLRDNQTAICADSLKGIISRQKELIKNDLNTYLRQQKEIDYYFGSHQLQDEGFDVVIRRKEVVDRTIDSLRHIDRIITAIDSLGNAQLTAQHRYMTDGMPCSKTESYRKGFVMFQTATGHTPDEARPVYSGVLTGSHSVTKRTFGTSVIPTLPPDTIYQGKRDSVGLYSGQGILATRSGFYYEGEFADGEPHGFGVAFDHRVRAGKWVKGRYRGEQPTYSANHVYGIDVSRYQHENVSGKKHWSVNWANLRVTSLGSRLRKSVQGTVNFPVSFVFIKATEGIKLKNKYYYYDYNHARANGLRVGSYHFFSVNSSAIKQANYFLANSRYRKGDMPPVLDLEPTAAQIRKYGGSNVILWAARVWMETVERRLGVKPILYVDHLFFNRHLSDDATNRITKKYDVWISRFGQYKPIGHLRFWQLCADGHVSGIHPTVDINVFNGNMESFKKYNR